MVCRFEHDGDCCNCGSPQYIARCRPLLCRCAVPITNADDDLFDAFDSAIENATTVDAVEVVHGHWVSDKADILFHCSVCETQVSTDWDYDDLSWNYCPNCGAKMDGDVNGC